MGRCRALDPEGAQGPPLLPGEHHLPSEPFQVSPWLEPGESGEHKDVKEFWQRSAPAMVLESVGADERPCVYGTSFRTTMSIGSR